MRILWQSNAPWCGTGYGVQTKLILRELMKRGHEVECFAFYGLHGGRVEYDGYPVWPASDFDPWGNDVIRLHLKHSKADAVVTLLDPFVLDMGIWGKLNKPWIGWVPIDCDNIGWETEDRLKVMNYVVAMSGHGEQQMTLKNVPVAETIYHAVDMDTFYEEDQDEARDYLGLPRDCFLIGMVMANKGDRKQFAKHFEAIKLWMERHPDENVQVFMHTDQTNKMGGWDITQLVRKFGLQGKVNTTSQYFTSVVYADDEQIRMMYSAMDVLMQCSAGEGFGVPIVEAQACGTPVIAHAVTSMTELVINGYLVNSSEKYLAAHGGFQYLPDVEDMADKLEAIWRRGNPPDLKNAGRLWVADNCSTEVIGRQWDHLLREVAEVESAHSDADPTESVPRDQEAVGTLPEPALD